MKCRLCDHPTRRVGESKDDHPGTLVDAGGGVCSRCRNSRRRTSLRESRPVEFKGLTSEQLTVADIVMRRVPVEDRELVLAQLGLS